VNTVIYSQQNSQVIPDRHWQHVGWKRRQIGVNTINSQRLRQSKFRLWLPVAAVLSANKCVSLLRLS